MEFAKLKENLLETHTSIVDSIHAIIHDGIPLYKNFTIQDLNFVLLMRWNEVTSFIFSVFVLRKLANSFLVIAISGMNSKIS